MRKVYLDHHLHHHHHHQRVEPEADLAIDSTRGRLLAAVPERDGGVECLPHKSSLRKILSRKQSPSKSNKMEIGYLTLTNAPKCGELQGVFCYLDENGDGKISLVELRNGVRTVGGKLSVEEAEAAVRLSDMDKDGMLMYEEFEKLMEMSRGEEKNNELRDAFQMYEMEGSGIITSTSLKRIPSRLGDSRSVEDCKEMIRKFDLNGDGVTVLSFQDFLTMMG